MMFKFLLPTLAGGLLLAGCQKSDATPDDNTPKLRPLTSAERQTVSSTSDFAYQEFKALRQAAPTTSLCISPLSISAALTMAYNGAEGKTKTAMQQTLGTTGQADAAINGSYQSLFALLQGIDKQVTFTVANSVWYNQGYQLKAPFVQTNQAYFGATVQGVDFAAPSAKNSINSWVLANTQGRIPSIIDQTSSDDVLYLLNALYFKGSWTYKFDRSLTKPEPFYDAAGSSQNADFMVLKTGRYRRYADGQQVVLDLPYGNRQFSMTFVVPQGTVTLADVAGRLNTAQLATWLGKADTTGVELHVPKFKFAYEKTLNTSLGQLGMGVAFSDAAEFGQMMAAGPKNLAISEVKHKTFLEMSEEGTEAAAVTSVGIAVTNVGPAVMRLNHPFIFLIREKASGAVLFLGQVTSM